MIIGLVGLGLYGAHEEQCCFLHGWEVEEERLTSSIPIRPLLQRFKEYSSLALSQSLYSFSILSFSEARLLAKGPLDVSEDQAMAEVCTLNFSLRSSSLSLP